VSSAPANLEGLEDLLAGGYSLSVVSGHLVVKTFGTLTLLVSRPRGVSQRL
jgi:hypothetical protein